MEHGNKKSFGPWSKLESLDIESIILMVAARGKILREDNFIQINVMLSTDLSALAKKSDRLELLLIIVYAMLLPFIELLLFSFPRKMEPKKCNLYLRPRSTTSSY